MIEFIEPNSCSHGMLVIGECIEYKINYLRSCVGYYQHWVLSNQLALFKLELEKNEQLQKETSTTKV